MIVVAKAELAQSYMHQLKMTFLLDFITPLLISYNEKLYGISSPVFKVNDAYPAKRELTDEAMRHKMSPIR